MHGKYTTIAPLASDACIQWSMAVLTFKAISTNQLSYLAELTWPSSYMLTSRRVDLNRGAPISLICFRRSSELLAELALYLTLNKLSADRHHRYHPVIYCNIQISAYNLFKLILSAPNRSTSSPIWSQCGDDTRCDTNCVILFVLRRFYLRPPPSPLQPTSTPPVEAVE